MKKKNRILQFPKNYRRITEKTTLIAVLLAISGLILFIFLLSAQIFQDYQKYRSISSQRAQLNSKLNSWVSILDQFPGYSDASFNIALLYFQLNNLSKSREYLGKTLIFDPNYPEAENLSTELEKRGF